MSEGMKGDAIFETSKISNSSSAWNSDYSNIPAYYAPFFRRGGYSGSADSPGLFGYDGVHGYASIYESFRVAFITE